MVEILRPLTGDRISYSPEEFSEGRRDTFKGELFFALFSYFQMGERIRFLDKDMSSSSTGIGSGSDLVSEVGGAKDRVSLVVSYVPQCDDSEAIPKALLEVIFPPFEDLSGGSFLEVAVTLPTPVFYGLSQVNKHDLSGFRGELTKNEGFMFASGAFVGGLYSLNLEMRPEYEVRQAYEFRGKKKCLLPESLESASRCFHSFEENIFRKMRSYRSSF